MDSFFRLFNPLFTIWLRHAPDEARMPRWLHGITAHYLEWWTREHLTGEVMAAQAARVGITTRWWPAATSAATILAWYHQRLQGIECFIAIPGML